MVSSLLNVMLLLSFVLSTIAERVVCQYKWSRSRSGEVTPQICDRLLAFSTEIL